MVLRLKSFLTEAIGMKPKFGHFRNYDVLILNAKVYYLSMFNIRHVPFGDKALIRVRSNEEGLETFSCDPRSFDASLIVFTLFL